MNESYEVDSVIGVHARLWGFKPSWYRKNQGSLNEYGSGSDKSDSKHDELPLEVADGSFIHFYKDGVLQPNSFENIYEGTYYAGVSLYMQARCEVNFGGAPFRYPPSSLDLTDVEPYDTLVSKKAEFKLKDVP